MINAKSQQLQASATLAIAARAKALQQEGHAVLNLSVGEPDFPTPAHVIEAAKVAMDEGHTRYTPAGGLPELKMAIQSKLKRDQALDYSLDEITCSNGGKAILFNAFQVMLNPGDEVLVPDPAWLSYESQIEWSGGVTRRVPTPQNTGFILTASAVEQALTPNTRALVLNSPANPTGAVIPAEELLAIAKLAKAHKLLVISDDVYEHFFYSSGQTPHILRLFPELKEQTLIVNAVSKSYSMTGWRLGYAAGPRTLIAKMQALQSQEASNPCSISQYAAIAALNGDQGCVESMRRAFEQRKKLLQEGLTALNIPHVQPQGAFYCMLDLSVFPFQGNDIEICRQLLEESHIALVPGSPFGQESAGWARMSFAVSDAVLEETLKRFAALLDA